MKVTARLTWQGDLKFVGKNATGLKTYFESSAAGEDASASSPMEVVLQAFGACTGMDVVFILNKRRKTVEGLRVYLEAERAEKHPRVFTEIFIRYELKSPDALMGDLIRAVELSLSTYCPVAAMFRQAGIPIHHEVDIVSSFSS